MAIRRSRGGKGVTFTPPIQTSPEVGTSSPAIMRKRVVLPDPDGPSRTRNSPSRLSRLTLLTAPSSPSLKTLVSSRVSTTAIALPGPPSRPLRENALQLRLRDFDPLLGGHLLPGHLGEHGGQDEGVEGFVDGRARVAGEADVGRPVEHVTQDLVLVGRNRLGVVRDLGAEVRDRGGEAGEVVELAGLEGGVERVDEVAHEMLGPRLVLRDGPSDVTAPNV